MLQENTEHKPSKFTELPTLLKERWETLPESLKTPGQLAGRTAIACGATHHVMERCNFACRCCYLSQTANSIPPLPFIKVQQQLQKLRGALGKGGKVQITAGEVTLLPVDELGRIIAYAIELGLDPMVMTHGQRFLDEPNYLKTLCVNYGLKKISIHIDSTQRGRPPEFENVDELKLNALREQFAQLIRKIRQENGVQLHAASTITVTADNIQQLPKVARWYLRNADAFRLLSFLPVAQVGRTQNQNTDLSDTALWDQIERGLEQPLNRRPMQFGHPSCNTTVPLFVAQTASNPIIFEAVRTDSAWDVAFFDRAINAVGRKVDWGQPFTTILLQALKAFSQQPKLLLETPFYAMHRLWAQKHAVFQILKTVCTQLKPPTIQPFLIVVHRFMDAAEMETPEGQERLKACVFKTPVNGELVSMCEMNATDLRNRVGAEIKKNLRNKDISAI